MFLRPEMESNFNTDSQLCTLMLADEIVLIAHSPEDLQNSLNTLTNFCAAWDLQVNMKKLRLSPLIAKDHLGIMSLHLMAYPSNTLLNINTCVCY